MNTCNNNVPTYITSTYRGFISFGCKDSGLQTSNLHNRKWEFSDFALTSVWNFHVLHICLRKPILWTEKNKHTWIAATHVEITVWSGSFYVRAIRSLRGCKKKTMPNLNHASAWITSLPPFNMPSHDKFLKKKKKKKKKKKTNQMSKLNRIKWEIKTK